MGENDGDEKKLKTEKTGKRSFSRTALIIEGTAILSALLSVGMIYSVIGIATPLIFFTAAFFLWTFIGPIIGIIMGILALCDGERSKPDLIRSIIAVTAPVAAVLTLILLFSTGVIIIKFM